METKKDKIGNYFLWITAGFEVIILSFLVWIEVYAFNHLSIFSALGIGLVIFWIGVLVAYYSWAIYFYNINLGITDHDWETIQATKDEGKTVTDEPAENPMASQTFGLPPGTVRGTIAITLLVMAVAILLVSFGKDNIIKENELLTDSFRFFENALLMMLAFYFGQKSLEYLYPKPKEKGTNPTGEAPKQ